MVEAGASEVSSPTCEPKDLIGTDGLLWFDMTALIVQMPTVRSGELVSVQCKFQGMVCEMFVQRCVYPAATMEPNILGCVSTATGPLHIGSTFICSYLSLSPSVHVLVILVRRLTNYRLYQQLRSNGHHLEQVARMLKKVRH